MVTLNHSKKDVDGRLAYVPVTSHQIRALSDGAAA
jgi:hypothetical protein